MAIKSSSNDRKVNVYPPIFACANNADSSGSVGGDNGNFFKRAQGLASSSSISSLERWLEDVLADAGDDGMTSAGRMVDELSAMERGIKEKGNKAYMRRGTENPNETDRKGNKASRRTYPTHPASPPSSSHAAEAHPHLLHPQQRKRRTR